MSHQTHEAEPSISHGGDERERNFPSVGVSDQDRLPGSEQAEAQGRSKSLLFTFSRAVPRVMKMK